MDTDVVSYLLNRHSLAETYEELLVGCTPLISFMTVAEMYRGAIKKNWGTRRIAELNDQDIDWLTAAGSKQLLRAGEILIQKGVPATALYVVLSGDFSVWIDGDVLCDIAEVFHLGVEAEHSFDGLNRRPRGEIGVRPDRDVGA